MKRLALIIMGVAVMSMAITSCKKDETANVSKYAFRAFLENNGVKTHFGTITYDPTTFMANYPLEWDETDMIMVSNGTQHSPYHYVASGESAGNVVYFDCTCENCGDDNLGNCIQHGPYHAVYPAEIWDGETFENNLPVVTIPDEQEYNGENIYQFPMYAYNSGNLRTDCDLRFSNICGALELSLKEDGGTVSSITITTDKVMAGDFTIQSVVENGVQRYQVVANDQYVEGVSPEGSNSITLNCNNVSIDEGKTFYIYLPTGTYNNFSITINTNNGEEVIEKKAGAGAMTFNRNHIKFFKTSLPYGGYCGLYSIDGIINDSTSVSGDIELHPSANTRQVFIAGANLLYNPNGTHMTQDGSKPGVWKFAENQFNYYGDGGNWLSRHNWNSSGYTGSFPTTNWQSFHTTGTSYANCDWGIYNDIDGDAYGVGAWRTLTYREWRYLLYFRLTSTVAGVQNARYCKMKVADTAGIVLFPDDFEWPAELANKVPSLTSINDNSGNNFNWSNATNLTHEEWAILESACCAFLPLHENGNTFEGYYWTATTNSSKKAYCVYINNGQVQLGHNSDKQWTQEGGQSVRLVRDFIPETQAR